jgi:hypothetical protein
MHSLMPCGQLLAITRKQCNARGDDTCVCPLRSQLEAEKPVKRTFSHYSSHIHELVVRVVG